MYNELEKCKKITCSVTISHNKHEGKTEARTIMSTSERYTMKLVIKKERHKSSTQSPL